MALFVLAEFKSNLKKLFYLKELMVYLFFNCLIIFCLPHLSYAQFDPQTAFLNAEEAIRHNNSILTKELLVSLKKNPLYPYLEYQKIKKELENNQNNQTVFYSEPINVDIILNYYHLYKDCPLADKLFSFWLHQRGQKKQWDFFLQELESVPHLKQTTSLQCYKIQADYHNNINHNTPEAIHILKPALALLMNAQELPYECYPVFRLLNQHNLITQEQLLTKHQSLLDKKTTHSLKQAKNLRTFMSAESQKVASLWENWIYNPNQLEKTHRLNQLNAYKNKIILSAFKHYIKFNVEQAKQLFEKQSDQLNLTAHEKGEIIKQIALSLATKHHPEASKWLNQIPDSNLDNKTREWQIRSDMKAQDWERALKRIHQLDTPHAQSDVWQYWKARALEKLELPGYQPLYKKLALKRSYYGFLAAGRLKQKININHDPYPASPKAIAYLGSLPAIERIKALFALKRLTEAHHEWAYFITDMNDAQKTQAAELAKKLKWHHLTIQTFNQTLHKDDVVLRFPLAFENFIVEHAQTHRMDAAWIFAIARQESQFNRMAISRAGAIGLMQLMPKTAAYIHKSNSFNLYCPYENIQLGTQYLAFLYEKNKNPIISTAAYNAGPTRVKSWLPLEPCDAEIWIESIPYEETRGYVQNVLAFMCIYKFLKNEPFLLERIMSPIQA